MLRSVLRSKLRPPRIRPDRIDRPRLFAQLDRCLAGQFTLVSAPAGYGKTTLLAQWVGRKKTPGVWLSLEESDNEPALFLEALVTALAAIRADSCQRVRALLAHASPAPELLARELSNDMEELEEFILVLDDFHNVKDARILEIVRTLVYQPPDPLHLILSCRADPMLPVGALRGRGLLGEIRAADLRFDSEEAVQLLDRTLAQPLSDAQVATLLDKTEGWAAGLHLAALSLLVREDVEQGIQEFAGSDRYIADYLMEELLTRLDPPVERYLTVTSILERLSAPLCAALLGDDKLESIEGRPVLEWLEESNLFVISLDEQREWFRYHHLFRELLRHRLYAGLHPDEVSALHVRAGEWLSANGRVDAALDHFIKARRPDLAADAVEARRIQAIDQERWRALAAWVGRLDPDTVFSRPGLVLVYAWLAHERVDWPDISRYCDQAEQILRVRELPPEDERGLRAEIAALRGQVSYWRGEGDKALAYSDQALEDLPSEHRYARAVATIFKASALQMAGDTDAAFELYAQNYPLDYRLASDIRLTAGMGLLSFVVGESDRPRRAAERMLARAGELGLETSTSWAHFLLGMSAYLKSEMAEAEHHFALVQPYASSLQAAKQSLYGLAWIRQSQGRTDEALAIMDKTATIVSELNIPLGPEVRLLRDRLAVLSGRPPAELPLARTVLEAGLHDPIKLAACVECPPVTALAILLLAGDTDDLATCRLASETLLRVAEQQNNVFRRIQCHVFDALVARRQGRSPEALASLERALALAAPGRLIRLFAEMGEGARELVWALAQEGRGGAFAHEVLASFPAAIRESAAHMGDKATPGQDYAVALLLTNRELDVLELLEQRLSNKEIARQLVISPATVKRHTLSIYGKLGVGGRREAVAKAHHLGLLTTSR